MTKKPRKPRAPTATLLKAVVRARARGANWADVAKAAGCSENYAASMRRNFPAEWKLAYLAAEMSFIEDVAAEAMNIQRGLLYDKDPRVREMAAHSVLAHRGKTFKQLIEVLGGPEIAVKLYSTLAPTKDV